MNKSRTWRRLGAAMVAVLAGLPGISARAATSDVPPSWVAYARLVGQQFQSWIEADDPEADRFHRYLDSRMGKTGSASLASPTILVRAWIGPDGTVTRVLFDSLGDAQADATLRVLLSAHRLSDPPPSGMRQPLRVRLHIEPNPDAAPNGAHTGSVQTHLPGSAMG